MPKEMPSTQQEAVSQLWHAVIGTNGEGLCEQTRALAAAVPTFVTKDRCRATMAEGKNRRRSTWLIVKDVALLAVAVLGTAKGLGLI